jgi:hypothetical protein
MSYYKLRAKQIVKSYINLGYNFQNACEVAINNLRYYSTDNKNLQIILEIKLLKKEDL